MENETKYQADIEGLRHLTPYEKQWFQEAYEAVGPDSMVVLILRLRYIVRELRYIFVTKAIDAVLRVYAYTEDFLYNNFLRSRKRK